MLNDPTRMKLIFALSKAELCVCDLASLVGLSLSAVSPQVRLLRALGLVRYRKEGRLAYYSLSDERVKQLLCDVPEHRRGPGTAPPCQKPVQSPLAFR